jgi:SAM-dependent methyltransferase
MHDEQMFEVPWWDRFYGGHAVWSGDPNPQLVVEASHLTPGTALDVGCGEGADAIWLATRGWQVTGVDFAAAALERAAAHAGGVAVRWVRADIRVELPEGPYDLVSAQFIQLPDTPRRALFARLAAAVAPGGTLLVVGHHPHGMEASAHHAHAPDMFYTAEDVARTLDPDGWSILAADARPRTMTGPDGQEHTIHDAVLRARRKV